MEPIASAKWAWRERRASPSFSEVRRSVRSCSIRSCLSPSSTGRFGAQMLVASENDGPVTLWLDSAMAVRRPSADLGEEPAS